MKKLKTPNRILQKIMIAILAIFVLFNFIAPIKVQAGLGGVLLTPIRSFVRFVGDCIMQIVQDVFVGGDIKTGWLVEVDEESGEIENIETGDYYNFKISPESIFSNKIPAFDINFFNPTSNVQETQQVSGYEQIASTMIEADSVGNISLEAAQSALSTLLQSYDANAQVPTLTEVPQINDSDIVINWTSSIGESYRIRLSTQADFTAIAICGIALEKINVETIT